MCHCCYYAPLDHYQGEEYHLLWHWLSCRLAYQEVAMLSP